MLFKVNNIQNFKCTLHFLALYNLIFASKLIRWRKYSILEGFRTKCIY